MPVSVDRSFPEVGQFQELDHVVDGRFGEIIGRATYKEQLLQAGRLEEAAKIRIGVYFQGGGQAVAEEVGFVEQLYKRGWFHNGVIDAVVGGSGGSLIAVFGVTGNSNGIDILERNCKKGLANIGTLRRDGKPVDFKTVREVIAETMPDSGEIEKASTKVFVLTYNNATQKREAHDLAGMTREEQVQHVFASCLIPDVGNISHVEIDGVAHNDGDMGGVPLEILDALDLSDCLIIGSGPVMPSSLEEKMSEVLHGMSRFARNAASKVGLASFSDTQAVMSEMWMRHWTNVGEDGQPRVRYGFVGPRKRWLDLFSSDWGFIQKRIASSRMSARALIGEPQVAVQQAVA